MKSSAIIAAAIYIAGAVSGALFSGYLADRYGRKKLFLITLAVYLAATTLTAFAFDAWWFYLFRFLTGAGIGGEYAAMLQMKKIDIGAVERAADGG